MNRFDHDHHAFRLQVTKIEQFGDLSGKALLNLWAARVNVNDARQLRQPDDAPVFRYVGDVRDAGEGKQMVLTIVRQVATDQKRRVRTAGEAVNSVRFLSRRNNRFDGNHINKL